jgi:hypothetical protein
MFNIKGNFNLSVRRIANAEALNLAGWLSSATVWCRWGKVSVRNSVSSQA